MIRQRWFDLETVVLNDGMNFLIKTLEFSGSIEPYMRLENGNRKSIVLWAVVFHLLTCLVRRKYTKLVIFSIRRSDNSLLFPVQSFSVIKGSENSHAVDMDDDYLHDVSFNPIKIMKIYHVLIHPAFWHLVSPSRIDLQFPLLLIVCNLLLCNVFVQSKVS